MQTAMPLINIRALLLALVTLFVANAHALSVGEMSVNSSLGEPLALSIAVSAKSQSELDSLKVRLAPRAVFEQSGVPYPFEADDIQFTIDDENGNSTLRVYTSNALDAPYLHLLIQLSWSGGSMLREYVALIDPTNYGNELESIALSEATKGIDNQLTQSGNWVTVASGDTVSSITRRYRPSNISVHQSWIALFNLNRDAFPSNNINLLEKGLRLKIPSPEQMLALSPQKAISKVQSLSPQKAISKVQSLSPTTKTLKEQASQPTTIAEQATPIQPPQQDALTIGGSGEQASSTANGINSTAVEAFLEGKFAEMASIKTDMTQFSEELVAIRGENKVVANRLLQVEAQLNKISQLLELQSQTLATLNYQARLQAQAMQDAKNLAVQTQQTQQAQLQAQQDGVTLIANQPLNNAPNNIAGSTNDNNGVQEKGAAAGLSSNSVEPQTLPLDSGAITKAIDESPMTENQRKQSSAKSSAAPQANTSEAQQEQKLKAQSDETNQQSFFNANDWIKSVVSVKDKVVKSFKDGTEKLTEGSLGASLVAILSKWGLYLLFGLLALIVLGRFVRRRDDAADEGNGREIDSEIEGSTAGKLNDGIDNDLSGQGSSIFTLGEQSMIQSDDSPNAPMASGDSSLFAVDEQDSILDGMDSERLPHQSTARQAMDGDPLTEAEVYLAYDKKQQAIKVLKQAYLDNPKDQNIAIKLLGLYIEDDDLEGLNLDHDLDISNVNDILKLDEDTKQSVDVAQLKLSDEEQSEGADWFTLDRESDAIGDAVKKINQHGPDASLALAKAYIELGEPHIAKDFISDVINSGNDELKAQANKLLKSIKS